MIKTPVVNLPHFALSLLALAMLVACRSTLLAVPANQSAIPAHYNEITETKFQYAPPYPPEYRVVLSDSVTGYLVPDRSLPLIQMQLHFRESTLAHERSQSAATALLGSMFRKGGSQVISADALDDSLDFLSASIASGTGTFTSSIAIDCMSKDFPEVLALMKAIHLQPAFDSSKLELSKASLVQGLRHRFDRPGDLLSALHDWSMWHDHPRQWTPLAKDVQSVNRNDLASWAKGRFAKQRVVFAVSGDFDRDSMKVALANLFSTWTTPDTTVQSPPPPLKFKNQPGVYIADKSTSQANIRMAQPFVQRPHPDYYPASVASYILGGGGFTSRLTARVRSDEGLAYSVYSFTESDYDGVGTAGVSLQTKVESAGYALRLIKEEIQKLAKDGPTAQEMLSAKESLVKSLPGLFDSPHSTASIFAKSELWGRSPEHFKEYPNAIESVTAKQVKQMIAKYFSPEAFTISVVGPAKVLEDSLSYWGKVLVIPTDSLCYGSCH